MRIKSRSLLNLLVTLLFINIIIGDSCSNDGVWPKTNEGEIASIDCVSGLFGKQQRVCKNKEGVIEWEEAFDKNCRILYVL